MVSPPKPWESHCPSDKLWLDMTDFYGGYLSNPTGQIYDSYHTISTSDRKNLNLAFGNPQESDSKYKAQYIQSVVNDLQSFRSECRIFGLYL